MPGSPRSITKRAAPDLTLDHIVSSALSSLARPMNAVPCALGPAAWPPDATTLNSSTGRSTPLSLRAPIGSTYERPSQKPPERVRDDHLTRSGLCLDAGGDVRGLTDGDALGPADTS